jgi:RHS repeat-associated protein
MRTFIHTTSTSRFLSLAIVVLSFLYVTAITASTQETYRSLSADISTDRNLTAIGKLAIQSLDMMEPALPDGHHSDHAGAEIQVEQELGLIQFGARWYAPGVGRWISPDLLFLESPGANVGSVLESNLYSYAGNDPTNSKDPTGQQYQIVLDRYGPQIMQAVQRAAQWTGITVVAGALADKAAKAAEFLAEAARRNPNGNCPMGGSALGCSITRDQVRKSDPPPKETKNQEPSPSKPDPKSKQSTKKPEVKPENKSESEDNFEAGKLDQDQTSSANNSTVRANASKGAAFEEEVVKQAQKTQTGVVQQVTVKTQSGVRTRIDVAGRDASTGAVRLTEAKSSGTAPLTKNQKAAFPEIEQSGATVLGKGKPGFDGGTAIPPTKVDIVRPE